MSSPDVLQSATSAQDPCKSTLCVSVLQAATDVNGILSNSILKNNANIFPMCRSLLLLRKGAGGKVVLHIDVYLHF